jgi:hypothetical protein
LGDAHESMESVYNAVYGPGFDPSSNANSMAEVAALEGNLPGLQLCKK